MAKPIMLCADSTCDLGDVLRERYHVQFYPFHVILDGVMHGDGVDLTPDDIYRVYREKHILPKTAAINTAEYQEFWQPFVQQGYDVIHITIGSGLSAAYNTCRMAAEEMDGVYAIDSRNLSSGTGLLVIEAAERIAAGMPIEQIVQELNEATARCHASFVIDTLEFLHKGGRCWRSWVPICSASSPALRWTTPAAKCRSAKNTAARWTKRCRNMCATGWKAAPI